MVLNAGKAVKMLSEGKTSPLLYCIVRSPDGRSVELVSSGWFSQPWYEDREIYVVGIASGWKDGIELLSSIMQETVSGPVKYICFNLGWLPGGDKSITTHWKTTSMALSQALDMLLPGGVLSVCVYPGHEAGAEELREIQLFFSALRPQEFNCLRQTFLNAGPGSPECYIVQKQ